MASFSINASCQAQSTDGVLLGATITALPVNAKVLLDDVFAAGVVNLEEYFESIANPRGCYIVADGAGCGLYFDGVLPIFTVKSFKQVFLEITDDSIGPSGELYLQLEMRGAAQRLRVFGWGDPD
jgi:hypothetical protein